MLFGQLVGRVWTGAFIQDSKNGGLVAQRTDYQSILAKNREE